MNLKGYYSSGQFAAKAHITKKTIRYYDEHNILKPSFVNENGARFYTDGDFARLQQVLFLKYLGFSLDEIREMTVRSTDPQFMSESLHMQLELIEEQMEQLRLMKQAIHDASTAIDAGDVVDFSEMLQLVNTSELESRMRKQYQNSSNLSARINLHKEFAVNKQGWFPWLYEECKIKEGMNILELGCGDASLWMENMDQLPANVRITLSDISHGMIRDVKKNIGGQDPRFSYKVMDAHDIHAGDKTYDLVIANHVLFYCDDPSQVIREVSRVLKPDGTFICSTYGAKHMNEITELVQEFDDRIVLSADKLYNRFGKDNGGEMLQKKFSHVTWHQYKDHLLIDRPEPLISYVLSCHGNQNRYIVDKYKDFRSFVRSKTDEGFYITKDAGIYCASMKKDMNER